MDLIANYDQSASCVSIAIVTLMSKGSGEMTSIAACTASGVAARHYFLTFACCFNAANNEIAHVEYLRAALGKQAISMPEIDIGLFFPTQSQTQSLSLKIYLHPC